MPTQNPVANPLGGVTVNGTLVTVDTYVNPPTKIPAKIRKLVADNQGYFIESVLGTIGSPIQGGAVLLEETFPEDFFLPSDGKPAPRAPGAEAPSLTSTRGEPKVVRPESWSGKIEVHDEARQRNNVLAVQRQFTQAANSFADILQSRGIEVLLAAIDAWNRESEATTNWHEAHTGGVQNADPQKMPHWDVAKVLKQFRDDKVGVLPDTVIMNTTELLYLEAWYPGIGTTWGVDAMFSRQGINRIIATPLVAEGTVIFLKSGAVGAIGWEKPLGQEYVREGLRFTDTYVLEVRPVYAMFDASAVWALTSANS